MSRLDLFTMALQNLWARKSRTAFNIFGIVVSCAMLLLVFAGTRGATDGLMNLFAESEFARHFAIRPGRDTRIKPKTPRVQQRDFGEGISEDRAERINEKLNFAWERKNFPATKISLQKVDEIREMSAMASVLPTQSLRVQLSIEEQKAAARVVCFSTDSSGLDKRVIAGNKPQPHSSQGKIWIDEYRAWQLGYKSDRELEELIGTKVKLRFEVSSTQVSTMMKRFAGIFGVRGVAETEQIAETFQKLFSDLDQTSLTEPEKEAVRLAANRLGLDSASTIKVTESESEPFVYREFEIAGIVKPPEESVTTLFQMAKINRGTDLLIDWRDFHAIEKATHPGRTYYYAIGSVANTNQLAEAVEQIEEAGFETHSALHILEKANVELGKVRLIVAAIALVILLIASVGIMNTMIIAVMERTPEFGIMKAVGARNSDIRWLMLIEAILTGILGTLVSLGVARLIDMAVSNFARSFLEERIRHQFDFSIFVYSIGDLFIVAAIAVTVCVLASLLPARRAANLDPIVAMKH